MNKRILNLARIAQGNNPADYAPDDNVILLASQDVEKFAELLVRECADAIVNDSRLNDVCSAANGCVRTIKEHFGVEE